MTTIKSFLKITIAIVFLAGLSTLLKAGASGEGQRKSPTQIEFCQFKVPSVIVKGYADFSIVYSFELDENKKPIEIRALQDKYLDFDEVSACLESWIFPDESPATQMLMLVNWEHAEGWTKMSIIGHDTHLIVRLTGSSPY